MATDARGGRWALRVVVVVVAALALGVVVLSLRDGGPSGSVPLTDDQQAWLDERDRTIVLGADDTYRPYSFFDERGDLTGITGDYVELLEERLGIVVEAIEYPGFTESLAAAEERAIDVVPNVVFNVDRSYLVFTTPFLTVIDRIFVRSDDGRGGSYSLSEFGGREVASVDGYDVTDAVEETFPDVDVVRVGSEVEGLRALSTGEVDAMIADLAVVSYAVRQEGITNLRLAGTVESRSDQRFGVRSDQPILRDILDVGLASIEQAERNEITGRWIQLESSADMSRGWLWALGAVAAGTVLLAIGIIIWNRTLRRRVERQTEFVRQSAEARARSEVQRSRLELAISQAAELVLVVDVDWTVRYLNPVYARMTDRSADDPVGLPLGELFVDVPDRERLADVREVIADTGVWRGRLALRGPADGFTPVDGAITSFTLPTGEAGGFVATLRNVTHEERLQRELERTDRLRAVGTLAAGIAHDFNNLLMPIVGNADLIASTDDVELRTRYLRSIREAAERATELVGQVRSFSVDEDPEPSLVDFREIVGGAVDLVRPLAGSAITVTSRLPAEPIVVRADPGRMHQLTMNLLTNAVQAMEGGGRLDVELGRTERQPADDGPPVAQALLVVADTGAGIDDETVQHVFDPYFSTRRSTGGTGLGLFTAIGVVRSLGGDIDVESAPGDGTTMRVSIPLTDGEVGPPTGDTGSDWIDRRRILLVDDDDAVCDVVAAILTRLGHDVDARRSGESALARVDDGRDYDLLLTDLDMPGMRGDELARRVRQRVPNIPVIVLTGLYDANALDQGWMVVEKPVSMSRLGEAVRAAAPEPVAH